MRAAYDGVAFAVGGRGANHRTTGGQVRYQLGGDAGRAAARPHRQDQRVCRGLHLRDPVTRLELRREFTHIQRELKTTVIIVTHDMAEAFALGRRIGVLDEGRIVICDRPEAVARSRDPRVRALVDTLVSAPDGGVAS